ncbi:MAG: hypothetical protein ACLRSG_06780 [Christensenellales bacterium]
MFAYLCGIVRLFQLYAGKITAAKRDSRKPLKIGGKFDMLLWLSR